MSAAKTVYATIANKAGDDVRLRADLPEGGTQVLVGVSGGGQIGWYNLERFEGGRLTAGTLRKLFSPKEASA